MLTKNNYSHTITILNKRMDNQMQNFNGNMCWMCMWCDPTASALSEGVGLG